LILETELITRLKNGDEKAFRYLVETYQRQVYNTVLALVQNAEEAEDIAQEVFVEVYETVDRFRGRSQTIDLALPNRYIERIKSYSETKSPKNDFRF